MVTLIAITLSSCLGFSQPPASPDRYEFESKHMGTMFRVVVYTDKTTAEKAAKAAFARVAKLENVFSDYKSDSECMKLCLANDKTPGIALKVSDDFARVLGHALAVSRLSDGAFDVTVGPMSKLWRLTRRTQELPSKAELEAAQAVVGYKLITWDAKAKTVTLAKAGMRLDFGGIAKGDAADQALAEIKKLGITSALVAASGDIAVGDAPPGQDGWTVEIAPLGQGMPARHVKLTNAAVSTSGDLFQFAEIKGVRYSHVLDPKTGLGQTGRRSVTVIDKRGIESDSLTKAAAILPTARAKELIEKLEGAALYMAVKETEEAKEVITETTGFAKYLSKEKAK